MATVDEQVGWLKQSAGVRVLEDCQAVHIEGDDARSWLNGQCTNDVRQVGTDAAVYALVASLKGRVLADLWVRAESDEDITAVAPRAEVAALLEYLDQFIIMEDVELTPREDLALFSVQGPRAKEVVQAAALTPVASFACPRLTEMGMDVWVSPDQAEAAAAALDAAARSVGGGTLDDAGWAAAHVALAVPLFGVDFGKNTYPQEAGLKARAVSFEKGCYQGQEVVCMLENRGQLKRRLVQLEGSGQAPAGGKLTGADGKRVGEITSSFVTLADGGTTLALGYLKRTHTDPGTEVALEGGTLKVAQLVGDPT